MCSAHEANSKSPTRASLKASLSGDVENPVLTIRLRNVGDVPIIVDKELVFPLEIVLVDNPQMSALGGGEPPIIAMGAVLANAVYDAVGARLLELPMTPERVKAALG